MIPLLSMEETTPTKVGLEYICESIWISQSESLVTIKAKTLEILISLC